MDRGFWTLHKWIQLWFLIGSPTSTPQKMRNSKNQSLNSGNVMLPSSIFFGGFYSGKPNIMNRTPCFSHCFAIIYQQPPPNDRIG